MFSRGRLKPGRDLYPLLAIVQVVILLYIFFFYDMVIAFLEDRQIYLSAYDFIQPDASLISNPDSMDPRYVTDRYSEILLQDLNRFKEIQRSYQANPASTVYHKTYAKYIDKNVKLLCRIIYKTEDC